MLWINQRLSKKIWLPFYSALEGMKKYELSNHRPIEPMPTKIDEFNELRNAIINLTEKNYGAYQKQKEFIENASHEMQTPLAVFQGKIDLLMQTQPLSEEQATLISAMEQVNVRLSKLNKSLLLLSKIDNNQFPNTEPVNLQMLVRHAVDQFRTNAEFRKITVHEEYADAVYINANRSLIEILVSNLLSNAIRYNKDGGDLFVHLHGNDLVIQNAGATRPLVGDRIFERFYKSGGNSESIGLGLAIVKEICDLYKFKIEYHFSGSAHQFTVHLHSE
jgi:signal transduction histidine kinase